MGWTQCLAYVMGAPTVMINLIGTWTFQDHKSVVKARTHDGRITNGWPAMFEKLGLEVHKPASHNLPCSRELVDIPDALSPLRVSLSLFIGSMSASLTMVPLCNATRVRSDRPSARRMPPRETGHMCPLRSMLP